MALVSLPPQSGTGSTLLLSPTKLFEGPAKHQKFSRKQQLRILAAVSGQRRA